MTTVETDLGPIEGIEKNGVAQFLGIRFAKPPVGDRRFLPPVPSEAWSGTYDATSFGNRSVQAPPAEIFGPPGPGDPDEDCLFLNIYTPAADDAKRPVMVWIHGGAYTTGSANDYDGSVLAKQGDVVVVTVKLPPRDPWLSRPLRAGPIARRLGRQRDPRPDRRPPVGAEPHRLVRWRPGQRHDLR